MFQNPELKSGNYTVVGIVRGVPRFRLGYERAGNIIDISPTRELFNVNDRAIFTPLYMKHLDEVGFEKISAQIKQYNHWAKMWFYVVVKMCVYLMNGVTDRFLLSSRSGGRIRRDKPFRN